MWENSSLYQIQGNFLYLNNTNFNCSKLFFPGFKWYTNDNIDRDNVMKVFSCLYFLM